MCLYIPEDYVDPSVSHQNSGINFLSNVFTPGSTPTVGVPLPVNVLDLGTVVYKDGFHLVILDRGTNVNSLDLVVSTINGEGFEIDSFLNTEAPQKNYAKDRGVVVFLAPTAKLNYNLNNFEEKAKSFNGVFLVAFYRDIVPIFLESIFSGIV